MFINEKGCYSLATTNGACVDLFFKMTQDLYQNPNFIEWIEKSWEESPLDTMKIIFQSRDCRGGKGTKKTFINAMKHLSYEHPDWVKENMDIKVTKVALEPVWHLPGIAKRLGVDEGELRKILFQETGGMFPELVTRPDLKVLLPP